MTEHSVLPSWHSTFVNFVEECLPKDKDLITYEVVDPQFDIPVSHVEFSYSRHWAGEVLINSHTIDMTYRDMVMQRIEHQYGDDQPEGVFRRKVGALSLDVVHFSQVRPALWRLMEKNKQGHLRLPGSPRPKDVQVSQIH